MAATTPAVVQTATITTVDATAASGLSFFSFSAAETASEEWAVETAVTVDAVPAASSVAMAVVVSGLSGSCFCPASVAAETASVAANQTIYRCRLLPEPVSD